VVVRQDDIVVVRRTVENIQKEEERFLKAVEQFCTLVSAETEAISRNIGEDEAVILAAQSAIAREPELRDEVFVHIDKDSVNAEYAFSLVCDRYIALFASLEDELMSARAADFRDIKNRILSILLGIPNMGLQNVPAGSVLVAEEISPSQAATLDPDRVHAVVTESGTRFSHIAIIVRALQIPAVVSVSNVCGLLSDGDEIIVDGERGDVLRNPDSHHVIKYKKWRQDEKQVMEELRSFRNRETRTKDGRRIRLDANLSVLKELSRVSENNVDGIGLFRTEALYLEAKQLPGEEEQFRSYRRVVQAMAGKPVVIRTLDMGGDKEVPFLPRMQERNPFLGIRGVRYCLRHTDIFKVQLTALLRASVYGNLRIMLPMITSVSELRAAKALIAEVMEELEACGIPYDPYIPVGIMVETPSAAICAGVLAGEADFFSIGTNDLTQYTMAVDRDNMSGDELFSPLHPAVLRMIHLAVEGAHSAGIQVGLCGEAAIDPIMVPLLIGMGVDELSVSPRSVLGVRRQIADIDSAEWKGHVQQVLCCGTPGEVTDSVRELLADKTG